MTLRNRVALTALPLALTLSGSCAKGTPATPDQQAIATKQSAAAHILMEGTVKDTNLTSIQKVDRLVGGIRKELAHPAPTLTLQGSLESGLHEVNYSKAIQGYYLMGLMQIQNVQAIQCALNKAQDQNIRNLLIIAIGCTSTPQVNPSQQAVYPHIMDLIRTNTDETSKFPFEFAVLALSFASRYPEYAGPAVSLLSGVLQHSHATPDGVPDNDMDTTGRFAKEALHSWGYQIVRDSTAKLQVVPKPQPAVKK